MSTMNPSKIVTTKSAPEAIVRYIAEMIIDGEMGPGDKLPAEKTFAQALGVAPMTLRAALNTLRELGLVETIRGRYGGTYIREDVRQWLQTINGEHNVSVADLRELTDWRRAISGEAAYLASQRSTAEELSDIKAAAVEFDEHAGNLQMRRISDDRLHTLIAKASKSIRLLEAEREIQHNLTDLIIRLPALPSVGEAIRGSHANLIAAIAAAEGYQSRVEMVAHAESTYDWCYSLLTAHSPTNKSPPIQL